MGYRVGACRCSLGALNVGLKDACKILTGSPFSCKHSLMYINVMSQKNLLLDENIVTESSIENLRAGISDSGILPRYLISRSNLLCLNYLSIAYKLNLTDW